MLRFIGAALAAFMLATPAAAANDLVIREFVVARQINGNEPVEVTDELPRGQIEAFAFARFDNIGAPTPVTFVWYHEGRETKRSTQTIGKSSGWRSYTANRMRPGAWRVALLGPDGEVMADRDFSVR